MSSTAYPKAATLQQAPVGTFQSLDERTSACAGHVGDLVDRLRAICDSLLGTSPEDPSKPGGPEPVPNGLVERVGANLLSLERSIGALSVQVERLASR